MTQETLSNMIDVAPTYVSSIENGHTKLSLATLLGIAQSLYIKEKDGLSSFWMPVVQILAYLKGIILR